MRDVTEAVAEQVVADIKYPVRFVELDFAEGPVRLWTGYGYISWDDKVWAGAGLLLSIEAAAETQAIEAQGARLQLAKIPELIAIALGSMPPRNRPCRIWLGFMNPAVMPAHDVVTDAIYPGDELVEAPKRIFTGKMDRMPIADDPENPVITLTAEDEEALLARPNNARYTHEDQQIDYPGDLFFEFVPQVQSAEIEWGS